MIEPAEVSLYDRFLHISRDAFDAGSFEAAYHGLAGALKCAEALQDANRLREIRDEAGRQLTTIDTEHPKHRIGSAAAATRGNPGVYRSLLGQIRAATAIADAHQS
jgi:hypothetical protein